MDRHLINAGNQPTAPSTVSTRLNITSEFTALIQLLSSGIQQSTKEINICLETETFMLFIDTRKIHEANPEVV